MSKSKFYLLMFISFLLLSISFWYWEKYEHKIQEVKPIVVSKTNVLKKLIDVEGMTCVGCEVSVEKATSNIKGVLKVKASHTNKNVEVEYDTTKTNLEEIKKEISKKGYEVK